ncbi:methyltransferase domain-containing protein [Actinoplanes sp. TBRC 11911]|uniref:class I SAM-dependent methyltransferase n=1 Tax=Actinoplanes sp. TBRC 11911 TaxID=2729386 RepID=UPI00145D7202|nr:class I SAM-dependent methyltransferase [Actinoplanes sp. TBRC 11911]NMO51650.1 methyltransferase domain-containing protein [Actinoplanes sp. TBRC 11911]
MTASYFDGWYADQSASSAKDRLMQRHLGLPSEVVPNNTLPWTGLAEVATMLRLEPGGRLLDLACGRGTYGGEIARRTGASLSGVDFSAEALNAARRAHPEADFRLGDITATGFGDDAFDAAVCIDAIQFGDPQSAGFAELRRVVRPGGRVVLTCWEARLRGDERVPKRLQHLDLAEGLGAAGFTDVEVQERTDWETVELGLNQEAAALDPGDDRALKSFHDEAVRSLPNMPLVRRVLATAVS